MKQHCLEFTEPGCVVLNVRPAPVPAAGEVLVRTRYSAISPGTEMLVYRGQWPKGVSLDATIDSLAGNFSYPVAYGYCAVGQVISAGAEVSGDWLGRRVFAFQPHQDLFCSKPENLLPVPDDMDDETALFLPSMETAVNLLLDGGPLIGEEVVVIGQGIIGLFVTALLSRFPLARLSCLEPYKLRQEASLRLGADECFDPLDQASVRRLGGHAGQSGRADLVYELSGNPAAMNTALSVSRFNGRVIVGSWYGAKKSALDLGSFFHRGRVSLMSSQVSTIAPQLTGRWTVDRRLAQAWHMLCLIRPSFCITHRFPLADAALAYQLIDRRPEDTVQVIFDHRSVEATVS